MHMDFISLKHLTWVEISKKALINNINVFKSLLSKNQEMIPVIKSNAYGHGILEIATIAREEGINQFAVNSMEEAIFLRKNKLTSKILVMGGTVPDVFSQYTIPDNIEIVVSNFPLLEFIAKNKIQIDVVLKIDTGLSRLGFIEDEIPAIIDLKNNFSELQLTGLMSHFANVEDVTNHDYARLQMDRFKELSNIFSENKIQLKTHMAGSAATFLFNDSFFSSVRIGISFYGLWPSQETRLSMHLLKKQEKRIQPVLTWKTRIVKINDLQPNTFVGYGCTYKTTSFTKIAILPIGYYEGYSRALSSNSYVIIKDTRAPVVGRVCMNMIMVDVTHIKNTDVGTEVILLGQTDSEEISADTLATKTDTINYEIVTCINSNLPRIVV